MRTAAGVVLGLAIVACSAGGGLDVVDAWSRPTPPVADKGAFYVTVVNGGPADDVFVSALSDRCEATQLHDTVLEDSVMKMKHIGAIDLAAGDELVMRPAGLHLTCLGLTEPLVRGESVQVTLEFETAGLIVVQVPVEDR